MKQTAFEVNMLAVEGFRRLASVEDKIRAEAIRRLVEQALEHEGKK